MMIVRVRFEELFNDEWISDCKSVAIESEDTQNAIEKVKAASLLEATDFRLGEVSILAETSA